jgi:hypothetical protein
LTATLGPGATTGPPRHDPRLHQPTRADRRRTWTWLAVLGITPVCVGIVAWAAVGLNGNYPTVKPPVPTGWKAVPGIYASFSVPRSWSLEQGLSDPAGDVFFGAGGRGVGESVTQATRPPSPASPPPAIVTTFLGGPYTGRSYIPVRLKNADRAFEYHFALSGGRAAEAVMAWARGTQSLVWLVAVPASPTGRRSLSTLALAP